MIELLQLATIINSPHKACVFDSFSCFIVEFYSSTCVEFRNPLSYEDIFRELQYFQI
ncbi:hypothetical protein VCUG_01315 [Vavraia culicis subsp. floridensis]|uniref:Uncharacterized protein n=1 Tax=Vavraia culicis (isolate floridensis) TaxID=948595 RepID=L2GVS3_VAVCU|nr:uncharacterized protein VCUG_01315 [Vavraia culicis subsp. floridensis]ELA47215.1 hypothetical protein VCUG_01315 [Vavraia culicis subsp. floridensis]